MARYFSSLINLSQVVVFGIVFLWLSLSPVTVAAAPGNCLYYVRDILTYPGTQVKVVDDQQVTFTPRVMDYTQDGQVDWVLFSMEGKDQLGNRLNFELIFATNKLGSNLVPGTYINTRRPGLAPVGHPGFSFSFYSAQEGDIGEFTIYEAAFSRSQGKLQVDRFVASFSLNDDYARPEIWGSIHYQVPALPFPIIVSPANLNVQQGKTKSFPISLGTLHSVNQPVTLSAELSPLVEGIQVSFTPSVIQPGEQAQMKVSVSGSTPNQPFQITIRAQSGAETELLHRTLKVLGRTAISMRSEDGDFVGRGRDYYLDEGWFTIYATKVTRDGSVCEIHCNYWGLEDDQQWGVSFSTASMVIPLQVGYFGEGTRLSGYGVPSYPQLDISGNANGCNELKGNFRILEIKIDYSDAYPKVAQFTAEFEQFCEIYGQPLRGTIFYNSTASVGYSLRMESEVLVVEQGKKAQTNIQLVGDPGYTQPVSLRAINQLGGAPQFGKTTLNPGEQTSFTIAPHPKTPPGTYFLHISGINASEQVNSVGGKIIIIPQGSFQLVLDPEKREIEAGQSTEFIIQSIQKGGLKYPIQLKAEVSPPNLSVGVDFGENGIKPGQSTRMTVRTLPNTPKQQFTIRITGTAANLQEELNAVVIVR